MNSTPLCCSQAPTHLRLPTATLNSDKQNEIQILGKKGLKCGEPIWWQPRFEKGNKWQLGALELSHSDTRRRRQRDFSGEAIGATLFTCHDFGLSDLNPMVPESH